MSQKERYGTRDGSYSAWHRKDSIQRFVGIERAQTLAMIDLDASLYVEYDDDGKHPLCLIETAIDVNQDRKSATVTRNLAKAANLRAYVLLYKLADEFNPADENWPDITGFRVKRLWPEPVSGWRCFTPEGWAKELVGIRAFAAKQLDEAKAT